MSKTKVKSKKIKKQVVEPPEELTLESVTRICSEYISKYDLLNTLELGNWKVKIRVEELLDEEGGYLGLCQFDRAYNLAEIGIAVQPHKSAEDIKDTLMHELVHIVLHEIDSSAKDLITAVPKNMRQYVGEQMHVARERSTISVSNTFRKIFQ